MSIDNLIIKTIMPSNLSKTFWIYGKHSAKQVIEKKLHKRIVITENFLHKNSWIKKENFTVVSINNINSLCSNSNNNQGIAVQIEYSYSDIHHLLKKLNNITARILILDSINDPQNIGSIMRSASAFSIDAIIITTHNSPANLSTIAKVSSGHFLSTPLVQSNNLLRTIKLLKDNGYWLYGLDSHTNTYLHMQQDFSEKMVIVMGSEQKGIRKLIKENCDYLLKIPMHSNTESLNVSNATTITLYEIYKRTI